jgi:hypothetical protein
MLKNPPLKFGARIPRHEAVKSYPECEGSSEDLHESQDRATWWEEGRGESTSVKLQVRLGHLSS